MKRIVTFFDTEDVKVLQKEIEGKDMSEIERKAHKLMTDSDDRGHKYYDLYLQSFHIKKYK